MFQDGHAKISDYGLAQVLTTYCHAPAGKVYYMAYEVAVGGPYDFSMDIWSLGIVFLEMFTRTRIFEMLPGNQMPCMRSTFPAEFLGYLPSNNARTLIMSMLKMNSGERSTISQVVGYLLACNMYSDAPVQPRANSMFGAHSRVQGHS